MKVLCVLTLAAGCGFVAWAADWPQWRGPDRTAISEESGLLEEWPPGGPELLWQVHDIGEGYGAPAVAGSRVYVVSNRGLDNEFVAALAVEDGREIWSTSIGKVGNPDQQPPYPLARSTPTVDGDVLFALSSDGELAAIQTATGEILWRKSLRESLAGVPGRWAYAESPLIDGDVLVVTPGGAEATIAALDKQSGETIWKAAIPGGDAAGYSSAIVTEAAGRKQYVQFVDKGVVGVDAENGEFLWRYEGTASGPANIPTPVAQGDHVYSSNARRFGGGLVRLSPGADGVAAEEVYFARGVPHTMGGQVLLEGILYGTNSDGLVAADFLTGQVHWQAPEGGPGSILYADGHLYVHYENGDVALVEATPEAYREKGRFTPPDQPEHPRGPREMAWAYPAVAGGRLYIRDLGTLWCYDVRGSEEAR